MAIQGKNSLSYKKKNVAEQDNLVTGIKNIVFAHEFTNVGENAILFNALSTPAAWTESGLSNPSGSTLLNAQLQAFKQNVEVTSSARGYIQKSEYVVQNSGIYFKNITSLANEIFEVNVSDVAISGQRIVDVKQIMVDGELLDTTTDFNIGTAVDVDQEQILVFRDGAQMFRSDDNDSSGATGNYYYLNVDPTTRTSSVIRFFEAAVGDEPIKIASAGGIADDPNISTFQEINTLGGQIDAMVPTLAALAGVPEANFQGAPNNVDLKQFGDRVISLEEITSNVGDRVISLEEITSNVITAGNNVPITGSFTDVLSITLPPGLWQLGGNCLLERSGGSSSTTYVRAIWSSTSNSFTDVGSNPNITQLAGTSRVLEIRHDAPYSESAFAGGVGELLLQVNSTSTIYVVTDGVFSGTWNAIVQIIAKKIANV